MIDGKGYFSNYFFARDFLASLTNLVFFVCVSLWISPELWLEYAPGINSVKLENVIGKDGALKVSFLIVVIMSLVYMLGMMSNRVFLIMRNLAKKAKLGFMFSERYEHKSESESALNTIYESVFNDYPRLSITQELGKKEKMERLLFLSKVYNPGGFQHVARDYFLTVVYRQGFVYSFCLFSLWLFFSHVNSASIVSGVSLFYLVLSIFFLSSAKNMAVQSLRHEYAQIFSSIKVIILKADSEKTKETVIYK